MLEAADALPHSFSPHSLLTLAADDEPAEGGLASLFVEMRPYIGQCRFGLSCKHRHEPDCAIKDAVETGEITAMRYESYIHILRHMPQ